MLVLQYERFRLDPLTELKRMYDFLDVDPNVAPPDTDTRVNERSYQIEKPDTAERAKLSELFRDEVDALAALLPELDLDLWT